LFPEDIVDIPPGTSQPLGMRLWGPWNRPLTAQYRQYLTQFIRNTSRSGVTPDEMYAQAAIYCFDSLENRMGSTGYANWRWNQDSYCGVARSTMIEEDNDEDFKSDGNRGDADSNDNDRDDVINHSDHQFWVENLIAENPIILEMMRQDDQCTLSNGTFFKTGRWFWKIPRTSEEADVSEICTLLLGYLIVFIPLCGKNEEVIERCRQESFYSGDLEKFIPIRVAHFRQTVRVYLQRVMSGE